VSGSILVHVSLSSWKSTQTSRPSSPSLLEVLPRHCAPHRPTPRRQAHPPHLDGRCSPSVRFVEAEYAGNIDYTRRLAVGDEHHTVTLMLLGPELNAGRLLAPVLAVQVMLGVLWWLGCPSTTPSPTATPCGSS
jgi:hypothetical protein